MTKIGNTWEWSEDDSLRIFSKVVPAVITASNGRKSFFNLDFFAHFDDETDEYVQPQRLGDNTFMSREVLRDLYKFMQDNTCIFKWKKG
jgi:hypothetical protein